MTPPGLRGCHPLEAQLSRGAVVGRAREKGALTAKPSQAPTSLRGSRAGTGERALSRPDRKRQNFALDQGECLNGDESRWAEAASLQQREGALSLCFVGIQLRPSFTADGTQNLSCWTLEGGI